MTETKKNWQGKGSRHKRATDDGVLPYIVHIYTHAHMLTRTSVPHKFTHINLNKNNINFNHKNNSILHLKIKQVYLHKQIKFLSNPNDSSILFIPQTF